MKDETAGTVMNEFVGLKPEMYFFLVNGWCCDERICWIKASDAFLFGR